MIFASIYLSNHLKKDKIILYLLNHLLVCIIMKEAYLKHCDERKVESLPPLALNAKQTKSVVDQLIVGSDDDFFLDLLTQIGRASCRERV